MADGTRFAEMKRDMDLMKDQLQVHHTTMEEMKSMLALIMDKVTTPGAPAAQGVSHTVEVEQNSENRENRDHRGGQGNHQVLGHEYQSPTKFAKVEFPSFDGDDLRTWVYKCEQFFEVDETPSHTKVKIAAIHLQGRASQWHHMYMKSRLTREVPNWEEYVRAFSTRFDTSQYEDPMSELMYLRQTGSIQEYLDRFDELMNCLELTDQYAISCLLGGMNPEIAMRIKMFQPKTLQDVIGLAKMQEQVLQLSSKRSNHTPPATSSYNRPTYTPPKPPNISSPRPTTSTSNHSYSQPTRTYPIATHRPNTNATSMRSSNSPIIPSKRLTNQEVDERRAKGQCFWCDEKYSRDHKCA